MRSQGCFQDRFMELGDASSWGSWNSYSRGNQMQNRRKELEVTGLLRWCWWCRNGVRLVSVSLWRWEEVLKDGSSCTWTELTLSIISIFKYWWRSCCRNVGDVLSRRGRIHDKTARRDPAFILARIDIKTVFDVATAKHNVKLMDDQEVHGWVTAVLHEKWQFFECQTTFGNVERVFPFTRCILQGSVEASRLWLIMTMQILRNVKIEWKGKKRRDSTLTLVSEENINSAALYGSAMLDIISLEDARGADDEGLTWLRGGIRISKQ